MHVFVVGYMFCTLRAAFQRSILLWSIRSLLHQKGNKTKSYPSSLPLLASRFSGLRLLTGGSCQELSSRLISYLCLAVLPVSSLLTAQLIGTVKEFRQPHFRQQEARKQLSLQPTLVFQPRLIWNMPIKHILRETVKRNRAESPLLWLLQFCGMRHLSQLCRNLGMDMPSFIFHSAQAGVCQHAMCKAGMSQGTQFQHTHLLKVFNQCKNTHC